jgi:LysM repeat protein
MDIDANIEALEHHYQVLYDNYQAGKIDDATFLAEVDKLQFQDSYGRYWMIGAKSGQWHYFDGQNWHQEDPRAADNLPFIDEQGRYWQRGVKSGQWYYQHPETGEWVKPNPGEEPAAPSAFQSQQGYGQSSGYGAYQTRLQPQNADTGPGMPSQLDGELFQDDEGRYWAVGGKSGQWYFYDYDGWHPAHEFQPQPQAPYYQPQTPPSQPYGQGYPPQMPYQAYQDRAYQDRAYQDQAYQGYGPYQPPDPQSYGAQPPYYQPTPGPQQPAPDQQGEPQQPAPGSQQGAQPAGGQTEPASVGQPPGQMPPPPAGESNSGSWYYFDGKQWLKYSSGEPEEAPAPPPKMVIDQPGKGSEVKVEAASEAVVAEVFEEDESPIEVVDVEVITVIEAEPDEEPELLEPAPEPAAAQPRTSSQPKTDEIRPRRTSHSDSPSRPPSEPHQPQRQPRERTSTDSYRLVAPRKKETAHEPTIIIPTGATASRISSPASAPTRDTRPVRPAAGRERRARENTLPMEPIPGREKAPAPVTAAPRRSVTQPMPAASPSARSADAAQVGATSPSRQTAAQRQLPAPQSAPDTPAKSDGYTFGDVLRSLPSTLWTFVGGVVALLACAIGVIFVSSWLQGGDFSGGGIAAVEGPTPTLDAGPPDATPTPGPTPTTPLEPEGSPTPVDVATFSSAALGMTLEYPETWEQEEEPLYAIFSPSEAGLDPENLQDASIWVGIPENESATIAELLTTVLSNFPADAETLNEGTISIASQTWTSAQIRFDDENLGGQGIATLAVTNKDGIGYYLVAVAPSDEWNSAQPLFQGMINSFRFSAEEALAQNSSSNEVDGAEDETEQSAAGTPAAGRTTPAATPTPAAAATPLTYIIQSGDTLLEIAVRFGVDADLLASENNITSPESLQLGQELTIPFTAEQLEAYNANNGGATQASDRSGTTVDLTEGASDAPAAEAGSAVSPPAAAPAAPAAEAPAPEAAPLGGRIAYAAFNPGTNSYDLWLADVASGEQNIIAGNASQPTFNRDGSLLAYRSWSLDSRGIFFRDFVGGRGGQVTRFVEDGLPTWAPDGYSFAFASRKEGDRVPRIYVGNQLGEETFSVGFQGEYPATFPDGRLVVKGCTPSGDCGLYIMGATGGGERKISGPEDTAPAVSPDGSRIAVMSSGRGATNWEIWIMSADGTNAQRLTNNGSNEGLPAWSPDGQSIAYASDQGGFWAIYAMNADGSNQRKLFNMMGSPDGYVLHDKDNSKGWLEERITWAP